MYEENVPVNLGNPINISTLGMQMQAIGVLGTYYSDPPTFIPAVIPPGTTDAQIQAVIDAHDPNAPVVPQSVTPAQARLALAQTPGPSSNTMLDVVDDYMTAINNKNDPRVIMWEYQPTFGRQDSILLQVTNDLGLTSVQIDSLFTLAATF